MATLRPDRTWRPPRRAGIRHAAEPIGGFTAETSPASGTDEGPAAGGRAHV